jgi:hypothetical protein
MNRLPGASKAVARGRLAVLCVFAASIIGAQAAPARVPSKLQLALMTKIFAQDESLRPRNKIRIQVVYDPAVPDSAWLKTEISELARGAATLAVGGREVETEAVPLDALKERPAPDIYFLCALKGGSFPGVLQRARAEGIRCFGSEPGDARRGAAVSITAVEGKPRIVLNKAAALAQGARFSESLIKLAEIL